MSNWRTPSWLVASDEPPIFALRRRRKRRQWFSLLFLLLLVAGVAFTFSARKWLAGGPVETPVSYVAPVREPLPPVTELESEVGESLPTESLEAEVPSESAPFAESEELAPESAPAAPSQPGTAMAAVPYPRRGVAAKAGVPTKAAPIVPGPEPPKAAQRMVWEKDGAEMVRVEGGSFTMGSESGDDAERPARKVTVNSFWLDVTEVTNAQYKRFVDAVGHPVPYVSDSWAAALNWDRTSRTYKQGADDLPVVLVSWDDAVAYARWAGKRLPTEAEWEYAARGKAGTTYPWGNAWDAARCNSSAGDPFDGLAPVGSFPSGISWCGALDMAGNVWEWCADWFSPTYYESATGQSPTGPSTGRYRVIRGGSWASGSDPCRASYRGFKTPSARSDGAGFRCAADA